MSIHGSKAPIIMNCGAAAQDPDVKIYEPSEPADLGNAVHDYVAQEILGKMPNMESYREKHKVQDKDSFEICCYQSRKVWAELIDYFQDPECEKRYRDESLDVTAIVDVVGHGDDFISVLDWKTGWHESDYWPQLMVNGHLAIQGTDYQKAYLVIGWLRRAEFEGRMVSRTQLQDYYDRFKKKIKYKDTYTPGSHCRFCPRLTECPAIGKGLTLQETTLPAKLTVAQIREYRPLVQKLEAMIKQYKEAEKAYMFAKKTVDMGDGQELYLLQKTNTSITVNKKSLKMLTDMYGLDAVVDRLKITKTAIDGMSKDKAKEVGKKIVDQKKEDYEKLDKFIDTSPGASEVRSRKKKEAKDGK